MLGSGHHAVGHDFGLLDWAGIASPLGHRSPLLLLDQPFNFSTLQFLYNTEVTHTETEDWKVPLCIRAVADVDALRQYLARSRKFCFSPYKDCQGKQLEPEGPRSPHLVSLPAFSTLSLKEGL